MNDAEREAWLKFYPLEPWEIKVLGEPIARAIFEENHKREREGFQKGYQAGHAAASERVRELETALREISEADGEDARSIAKFTLAPPVNAPSPIARHATETVLDFEAEIEFMEDLKNKRGAFADSRNAPSPEEDKKP